MDFTLSSHAAEHSRNYATLPGHLTQICFII